MRYTSLLVYLLLVVISVARADTVTLNNGDEIYGVIQEITDQVVIMRDDKGQIHRWPKKELLKISWLGLKRIAGENKPADIQNPQLRRLLAMAIDSKHFPQAGHVTLLDQTTVTLARDGSLTEQVHVATKILQERSRDLANVAFYYKKGEMQPQILFARTIQENALFYLNEEAIQDEAVYYLLKEYDKLHKQKFALPKAGIGTVIEYCYQVRQHSHDMFHPAAGEFEFWTPEPKKVCRLVITVSHDCPFYYSIRNNSRGEIHLTQEQLGTQIRYTFSAKELPGYVPESQMPPSQLLFAHVIWGVDYGLDKLVSAYSAELQKRAVPSPALEACVARLCHGLDTPAAKARALFNYVVKEVSLQEVPLAHYAYLPQSAAHIFANKYANALDKAFLLHVMLQKAGISSEFCYGRSKTKGPVLHRGNIAQFDCAAVYLPQLQRYLFPLQDSYAWDEIPPTYQGAQVLRLPGGTWAQVPLLPAAQNGVVLHAQVTLQADGSLTQQETFQYYGQFAAQVRAKKAQNRRQRDRAVENAIHGVNAQARLCTYSYEHLQDLNQRPVFKCRYQISDYALKARNKFLVLRLPRIDYSAAQVGADQRRYPIFSHACWSHRKRIEISLPPGYQPYYVPANCKLQAGAVIYRAKFEKSKGKIIFQDEIAWQAPLIPAAVYPQYKKLMEQRAKMSQEWLVLYKPAAASAGKHSPQANGK